MATSEWVAVAAVSVLADPLTWLVIVLASWVRGHGAALLIASLGAIGIVALSAWLGASLGDAPDPRWRLGAIIGIAGFAMLGHGLMTWLRRQASRAVRCPSCKGGVDPGVGQCPWCGHSLPAAAPPER